jgi:hypothetical protein
MMYNCQLYSTTEKDFLKFYCKRLLEALITDRQMLTPGHELNNIAVVNFTVLVTKHHTAKLNFLRGDNI